MRRPGELGRALYLYYLLRLGVLLASLALLRLAGLRGFLLVALAFVVSGLATFPLGRRQRAAIGRGLQQRRGPRR